MDLSQLIGRIILDELLSLITAMFKGFTFSLFTFFLDQTSVNLYTVPVKNSYQ